MKHNANVRAHGRAHAPAATRLSVVVYGRCHASVSAWLCAGLQVQETVNEPACLAHTRMHALERARVCHTRACTRAHVAATRYPVPCNQVVVSRPKPMEVLRCPKTVVWCPRTPLNRVGALIDVYTRACTRAHVAATRYPVSCNQVVVSRPKPMEVLRCPKTVVWCPRMPLNRVCAFIDV